jgi:hypothetical protein
VSDVDACSGLEFHQDRLRNNQIDTLAGDRNSTVVNLYGAFAFEVESARIATSSISCGIG